MPRCTFNNWVVVAYTWFLRCFGNTVDIASHCYDWFTRTPFCSPCGWYSCYSRVYFEPILAKNVGQVFGSFYFLETQFAETEYHIDHYLGRFFLFIYLSNQLLFQCLQLGG